MFGIGLIFSGAFFAHFENYIKIMSIRQKFLVLLTRFASDVTMIELILVFKITIE